MTTQFKIKRASETLFIILIAVCSGAILAPVHAQKPEAIKARTQYQVSDLPEFGGTSSGGNSINDQSWVAGYSRLAGKEPARCAVAKQFAHRPRHTWWTKQQCHMEREEYSRHHRGYFSNRRSGASRRAWSSAAFYSAPNNVGYINLGFVWEQTLNQMRGLPNFPGGNNGFATGANNLRQAVGMGGERRS